MYIQSIMIDGFKSYAQRTEIHGFDPMFNAITGLNGSGKSNILDAICFLLGITNLSQVRATNLQELVYKNGQAGVSKATVGITFDNTDKNQSPLGYEQYDEISITRQVVIGGRNKYLINGSNANNARVQDLFRSVQLNVNNPHFLIMQGRITKVLNMKPPEILSMIEEAAGTRLYESKKETAQRTIEKKDAKLKEIDRVLSEEITPTLTRLKDERSSYLEYQKVLRELEHLNKLYIAYKFVCAEETKQKSADELVQMKTNIQKLQDLQKEHEQKMEELEGVIAELEKKRDKEAGGALAALESALKDKQKEEAKASSEVNHKKESIKAEQKKLKDIKKQHDNDASTLQKKKKDTEKIEGSFASREEQSIAAQEAHAAAQQHYHAVSAGLSRNKEGEAATLQNQLMAAKEEDGNAETETKQGQMRLKHAQEEVKTKEADLKKTETSYQKEQATHDNLKKRVSQLESELEALDYEEGREERMTAERRQLSQEVQHLQDTADKLEAKFPQLHFEYKDPERGFDRSKVHGMVAKLIQVKDVSAATALEVSAGGKLYNVVVDDEVTGKKIINQGQLKRRVTIIPLNKISTYPISSDVVKRAESLVGKPNVRTALSLVGYDQKIKSAMEFVFGNAFVCKDMNTAKKVTFDSRVMKKSVTLDGESFDPAGTLTGGARPRSGSVLTQLCELVSAQQELHQKQEQLKQLDAQLQQVKRQAAKWRGVKQQYDLRSRELQLLEDKLAQTSHAQQMEEVNALKETIVEQDKIMSECKSRKDKCKKLIAELQHKIKNAKALREQELKNAEKEVAAAKIKMEETLKKTKEMKQEVESLQLEAADLEKELVSCEEQIRAVEETLKGYDEQIAQLNQNMTACKAEVKEAQSALTAQKDLLKACNKDICERLAEHKGLQKEHNQAQLKAQELQHKVDKCSKDSADAAREVEHMLIKYTWIADEKKYFGQPNTTYDFKINDPKEAGRRIQKLNETKEKLSKSVNMRAMNMLGKAEEQYNELMKKRRIVLNDKAKIASVIEELDQKKNLALTEAHCQVNKDFGSIFSTLLPGTQAKLVAPEGKSILDGVEVKIAFGDVWKESLSELSGGQRSLVALSLILSLLLFKPAPLYILDEVDAALDLSHTQNIGQIIRTHFKHSQFIVVSLKDGMFNNANVLFRTKFVDGVSTVTRFVQNQSNRSGTAQLGVNRKEKEKGRASKKTRRN